MFCAKCGAALRENSQFCDQCGQPAQGPILPQAPGSPQFDPTTATGETSGKALASLVVGIFGLLFFPIAIGAIILGHMSRSEIRKSNGRLKGDGMATAGLVMGYGAFAIIPFILIIAAIAIPNLLRARLAANEASAASGVRTIITAEAAYQEKYPTVGYTCSLTSLGGNGTSVASPEQAQLIDEALASGEKHGYRFAVQNCVNSETEHKYQVVAYPAVRNQTGVRAFCSDESGVIKIDPRGSPDECVASGGVLQ